MKSPLVKLLRRLPVAITSRYCRLRLAMRSWGFAHILLICLLGALACRTASAQIRDRTIQQYVHTAWGEKEGAPSGILALAQTQDGYLWLGTISGLYRFDGVSFDNLSHDRERSFRLVGCIRYWRRLMTILGSASVTERSAA